MDGEVQVFNGELKPPSNPTSSSLPPELWSIIFYWATYTSLRDNDISVPMFRDDNFLPALEASLPTRRNLVKVHSQWRDLATPFLFEDIRINRNYLSLSDKLESSKHQFVGGVGKFVRRVEIIFDVQLAETDFQEIVLDILHCCPNVQVLSNFPNELGKRIYQFPASLSTMPLVSIRRLDWEISDNTHFVPAFLKNAENIEVMSLGCRASRPFVLSPMYCPSLHTIILKKFSHFYDDEPCWRFINLSQFPSLTRLVLEEAPRTILSTVLLTKIAQTIRSIELRPRMVFLRSYDLPSILCICLNLETLAYAVFFTRALSSESFFHATIRQITFYSWMNQMYDDNDGWQWDQLRSHFNSLTTESFPSLQNVVLLGDWNWIIRDARFTPLLTLPHSRNVIVQYDGRLL